MMVFGLLRTMPLESQMQHKETATRSCGKSKCTLTLDSFRRPLLYWKGSSYLLAWACPPEAVPMHISHTC